MYHAQREFPGVAEAINSKWWAGRAQNTFQNCGTGIVTLAHSKNLKRSAGTVLYSILELGQGCKELEAGQSCQITLAVHFPPFFYAQGRDGEKYKLFKQTLTELKGGLRKSAKSYE